MEVCACANVVLFGDKLEETSMCMCVWVPVSLCVFVCVCVSSCVTPLSVAQALSANERTGV